MAQSKNEAKRIASWYNFARGPYKLQIEDETKQLSVIEARKLADALFERTGSFCGEPTCRRAVTMRYVRAIEPTIARCYDCHNGDYSAAFTTTTRE